MSAGLYLDHTDLDHGFYPFCVFSFFKFTKDGFASAEIKYQMHSKPYTVFLDASARGVFVSLRCLPASQVVRKKT